ncbi:MAG: hypothetical protein WCG32_06020, partial [Actinomycetes bacterium]
LQQYMISNGFYLYNSTTAQNIYFISLVYNSYQYGNQILVSPVPSSLPSGYSLPNGYTSATIFGGMGFPSTSTRTPFIAFPFTSSSNNTLGTFLGFGSSNSTATVPQLTSQPISTIASGGAITANIGSGATFTFTIVGGVITGVTITNGGSNYYSPVLTLSGGGATVQANITLTAVNGVITGYSIVSGGSGYSSQPTVSIAGGVYSLTITNGGSNYTTAYAVFSGAGGTTANLTISKGVITGYNITNNGSGMTTAPSVIVSAQPLIVNIAGGVVTGVIVVNGGYYTSAPTIVFINQQGFGIGATATVNMSGNTIASVTVNTGGSAYMYPPIPIIVTNNGGSIQALQVGGVITQANVAIISGGSGYVNPTITFSGGGATTQATGTVTVTNGVITGVNITNQGAGYTSNPTITINPNGGSYSGNSTSTPVGSTVNSIIMRCSIVKNNVTNPNDILDSFPITAGTAFGTNINYTPTVEKWVKVANGSFSNFVINFCDQNLNLISALDSNILITLLLRFPNNYAPPNDYGGYR